MLKMLDKLLYLIEILHQTTTTLADSGVSSSCILLKFYIKPQHVYSLWYTDIVVSYWNSTSNHNEKWYELNWEKVVSYWNSTSNHNAVGDLGFVWLGCILLKFYIKPQQWRCFDVRRFRCILLKFYIKPQLCSPELFWEKSCILLKFYIKPQLIRIFVIELLRCILLKFYIKPQRKRHFAKPRYCCILLKFYIKPQLPPFKSSTR